MQQVSTDIHHERELKWAINADDHQRLQCSLLQRYGQPQVYSQDNRFLDTAEGHLRRRQMSVRLRRENAHLLLTCKRRRQTQGALHHQEEQESWLNALIWEYATIGSSLALSTLPLPARVREACGGQQLWVFGGFQNRRLQWQQHGELICLDSSRFSPTHQDYELEIEISGGPERETWWQQWCHAEGIHLREQPRSKLQRMVEGPTPSSARSAISR